MDSIEPTLPPSLRIADGRFTLDPRDPIFVQNPYPAYAALRNVGRIN